MVYVCENNAYGATTSAREVVSVGDIAVRAAAYDIPGVVVDGQDVIATYDAVAAAVARARSGDGPTLVEAKTYRYDNHSVGMHIENYRTAEELEEWKERDPIVLHRASLLSEGILSDESADRIEQEVMAEVAEAVEFAKASPFPAPEEAFEHVFATPLPARG